MLAQTMTAVEARLQPDIAFSRDLPALRRGLAGGKDGAMTVPVVAKFLHVNRKSEIQKLEIG